MDQIKIGKFIQEKRKEKGLTQSELAEKLCVTDRSISKWESGLCLPDASNMVELCKALSITINDLFSGEIVDKKNNEKKLEQNLLEMTKIKEKNDEQLRHLKTIIGYTSSISFMILIFVASYIEMLFMIKIGLIVTGLIILIAGMYNILKIQKEIGYYECKKCHYKYVPNNKNMVGSLQFWKKRYLKCPKCNFKSWHREV